MASKFELGGVVALLVAVAGGALWIGGLEGDVRSLERRVSKLEADQTVGPRKLAVGDVCYKLLDSLDKALDDGDTTSLRTTEIQTQIDRFKCYENMPARMELNEVQENNAR